MYRFRFRKTLSLIIIAVQVAAYSLAPVSGIAHADDATPPVVCPTYTGTHAPTGASAHTFTYNPETCRWENTYYTWSPVDKQFKPRFSTVPIYNPATNANEYTTWDYSPVKGAYVSRIVSQPLPVDNNPQDAQQSPTQQDTSTGSSQQDTIQQNSPAQQNSASTVGSTTITNTGQDSNNAIQNNQKIDGDFTYDNDASVFQTILGTAISGDAFVMNNTTGGDATSGDANNVANVLNMLQSSWNPTNGSINVFSADLHGNYFGDLIFNPSSLINQTGPGSDNQVNNQYDTNLTVNTNNSGFIQNDITLTSQSGDATVANNTTGGDATSGDATAIANVLNLINSSISSGNSFIGSLNLYGELNGDILLPPDLLAQILNSGTGSNNHINNDTTTDVDITDNYTASITNNTDIRAVSGSAAVTNNTTGGDATSGDAVTSVNQANLIGTNATGGTGLYVVVNVLGQWFGMLLGGNGGNASLLNTGPGSNNQVHNSQDTDIDINTQTNYEIVNTINLSALTGDATVANNTTGGDATSGDATATANIINLIDSQLSFSETFGILILNVFGSWSGSFGVDTAAGNKVSNSQTTSNTHVAQSTSHSSPANVNPLSNVIAAVANITNNPTQATPSNSDSTTDDGDDGNILSAATTQSNQDNQVTTNAIPAGNTSNSFSWWIPITLAGVSVVLFWSDRITSFINFRNRL